MKIVSKSDIGLKRTMNQDSFNTGETRGAFWAVVCDGMGGANGGNVASKIAVKTISDCIINTYHDDMNDPGISAMLESAIMAANLNIYDIASDNEELKGMGTTVVVAIARDDGVIIAHAGDSRAYIYGKDGIYQLTRDHSIVQRMIENGELTPDEARFDPRKNVITRALGVAEDIKIDFTETVFPKDSVIILCSDGLSNLVDPEQLASIIKNNPIENCPQLLTDAANAAGGHDNITVVLIKND